VRILRAVLLSLFFGPLLWAPPSFAAGTPAAVVDGLHAALLNNMKHGKEYGCDGRIKHLEPVVDGSFDAPLIAQTVMRRHWSEISEPQRNQLVTQFREIMVETYASQFNSFGGESFTTQETQSLPNGDQMVHARLTTGGGDSVAFDYILRGKDGNYRIINVVADGVSDLALRSTQYNRLFEQKGFDGLIGWLQDQSKKMRASCG
jgi:phospholipid transport system substrate-binding protein